MKIAEILVLHCELATSHHTAFVIIAASGSDVCHSEETVFHLRSRPTPTQQIEIIQTVRRSKLVFDAQLVALEEVTLQLLLVRTIHHLTHAKCIHYSFTQ